MPSGAVQLLFAHEMALLSLLLAYHDENGKSTNRGMVCVPAHKNGKMHKLETQACGGNGMVLVKILKINWGLDFLWSKIYDKGMVKERQGKCVMILYHNPLCVLACTGTQNRIKEEI